MNMTITSKKQSQAKADWMAKNSKMFAIRVMKNSEPDLWDFLQSVSVPSATIKAALREYMASHNKAPQSEENSQKEKEQ